MNQREYVLKLREVVRQAAEANLPQREIVMGLTNLLGEERRILQTQLANERSY